MFKSFSETSHFCIKHLYKKRLKNRIVDNEYKSIHRHAHKGTVMDVRWNKNGNWFLTASRDHQIKLYDIRNLKQELQVRLLLSLVFKNIVKLFCSCR